MLVRGGTVEVTPPGECAPARGYARSPGRSSGGALRTPWRRRRSTCRCAAVESPPSATGQRCARSDLAVAAVTSRTRTAGSSRKSANPLTVCRRAPPQLEPRFEFAKDNHRDQDDVRRGQRLDDPSMPQTELRVGARVQNDPGMAGHFQSFSSTTRISRSTASNSSASSSVQVAYRSNRSRRASTPTESRRMRRTVAFRLSPAAALMARNRSERSSSTLRIVSWLAGMMSQL